MRTKKNEIKPWKVKCRDIPPLESSDFVAHMEFVPDVYKTLYNKHFPVVCTNESLKQLIKQTRISILRKPGSDEKEDYEYDISGVAHIFMANEPLKGERFVKVLQTKTKRHRAQYIKEISDRCPKAQKIRLVMNNLNRHKPAALYETLLPEEAKRLWDRFEFIYTPKHCSWLNIEKIEMNVLMGQCLKRRIDNMSTIREEVDAWQQDRNNKKAKINWQFNTRDASLKLKRLYPTLCIDMTLTLFFCLSLLQTSVKDDLEGCCERWNQ